jgi:protocatechuate 3,4-dioxygenase beta subunit
MSRAELTRRRLLQAGLALPLLAACGDDSSPEPGASAPQQTREPTPSCGADTVEQTEGPFFVPESPARRSLLEPGLDGIRLLLAGTVTGTDCRPAPGALLDFWQADDRGEYDNSGFRLRGHQRADSRGRYRLETIVPGEYTGRTPHIHVKVQPRGGRVLTTQLYFPGVAGNAADAIFDPALLIDMRPGPAGSKRGSFDFVVA